MHTRPQGTSASQHLRKNRLLRPQSVDCLTCKCIEASRYQVVAKAFLHYGGEGGLKHQASGKPRFTSEFAATAFTTALSNRTHEMLRSSAKPFKKWRKTVARSSPSDELRDLAFSTLATLLRFGFRCGQPNTLCAGIHEPGRGGCQNSALFLRKKIGASSAP